MTVKRHAFERPAAINTRADCAKLLASEYGFRHAHELLARWGSGGEERILAETGHDVRLWRIPVFLGPAVLAAMETSPRDPAAEKFQKHAERYWSRNPRDEPA